MFPHLDSARLTRSFEYFVEHYGAVELITPEKRALDVIVQFVEEHTGFLP
jgi:hypothetical protein